MDNACRKEIGAYIREKEVLRGRYFKSALVVSSEVDYGILRAIKCYSYSNMEDHVYICYSMDYAIDAIVEASIETPEAMNKG